MSSEWSTLEEVADVIDSLHKTPTYSECGLPMVRGTDVKYGELNLTQTFNVDKDTFSEFSRRYKPAFNDIIITRVGSYGITARVTKTEFCLGQNTSAIVPTEINPRYLYSALNSSLIWSQIESGVVGSTQKTLSLKVIKALKIPRHGENSETEIATILGTLDDRITLLRETNATLEAIAQALFKSWFVDFDPVHAKAQGRQPEGMDEQTAALFPDRFVESELGMVPLGWEVGMIDDVCDFQNGYAFKSTEMSKSKEDTYKIFKMGNIKKGGGLNRSGTKDYFEKAKSKNLDRYLLKKGDLLMCMTDMKNNVVLLGHTALMDIDDEFLVNQRVGMLRSKNKKIANFPFLYLLTNSDFFIADLRTRANSGVQVNLSTQEIKNTKFVLPPEKIHQHFNEVTEAIYEKLFILEQQQDSLADLRDSLLPRLISGQLRLPDVEA
jgi:type I restriction enzyme S subunit